MASLSILPTMNIDEDSSMTSDICLQLVDAEQGLERNITMGLMFTFASEFADECELLSYFQ